MSISLSERDRRWNLLQEAMEQHGFDVLLLAANDYRGHKGSLRYVADYDLIHRFGYAVVFPGREPILVLPQNLQSSRRPRSDWVSDYRYPRHMGKGLLEILSLEAKNGKPDRVGIVGLGQVMKVDDYLALSSVFPRDALIDSTGIFEAIRARKSDEEIRAAEESAYIVDGCFDRLLDIARPGMTERAITAEMYREAARLGGEDFLYLTMHTDTEPQGNRATSGSPRDRVLHPHDVFTFSFEVTGPDGYWVEFSRMVTFARPSEPVARMARAVSRGMEAARTSMELGVATGDVQEAVIAAIESEGATSTYWSGHGLGLDVLEEPWIGLDVVQDSDATRPVRTIELGMLIAVHPKLWDPESETTGYMADTYVTTPHGAQPLSRHPLQLCQIP